MTETNQQAPGRPSSPRPAAPPREPVATLVRASKSYGAVRALVDMDFAIRPGEVVTILGPNGAGKTTAVSLLLGLIRPSSGTARLFGLDPRRAAARTRVGAMLQISRLPETLQVREHILLTSSYYPRPLPLPEVLSAAGLVGLEKRHFGKLSGGQRQRVLFALALCGDPELLFLDEPTAGLDVETRRSLWERIARRAASGGSVLLTTHQLEEADALSNRIVLLDRGQVIAEGTPAEIKSRVSGRKIRCRTRLSAADLATIPGVRTVRVSGAEVELFAPEAERAVRELLARDPELSDLEVKGADLEEAFLALTRGVAPAQTATAPAARHDAGSSKGAAA
ncbi:MAG TPA: ABC transporter ATP-binding protein [Thermoanaerobaculia bacterium]|nr:ABC transporter ATP-binding protein [Thermoanaerobaculia bacterium]